MFGKSRKNFVLLDNMFWFLNPHLWWRIARIIVTTSIIIRSWWGIQSRLIWLDIYGISIDQRWRRRVPSSLVSRWWPVCQRSQWVSLAPPTKPLLCARTPFYSQLLVIAPNTTTKYKYTKIQQCKYIDMYTICNNGRHENVCRYNFKTTLVRNWISNTICIWLPNSEGFVL